FFYIQFIILLTFTRKAVNDFMAKNKDQNRKSTNQQQTPKTQQTQQVQQQAPQQPSQQTKNKK
ncbi:MAG: hypothetical protein RR728_07340, partial [Oscillospiraceae bacterium]